MTVAPALMSSPFPALFMIPVPEKVSVAPPVTSTPDTVVPASNTRLDSSVTDCSGNVTRTVVVLSIVATSSGPLGTVGGIQFSGVYQSLLIGLLLQVALPANERAAI